MANLQYVGARYVPKFFENPNGSAEWLSGVPYEALTVVTYLGNSYTSKIPVPAGVDVTNTKYWVATGNFNSQVQEYQEVVKKYRENSTDWINLVEKYNIDNSGQTDVTISLNSALNEIQAGCAFLPGGHYLISGSIYVPKSVELRGSNLGELPVIKSETPVYLNVKGGGDNVFNGCIENIYFMNVGIVLGANTADYANKLKISNCRFSGNMTINGITMINNCWDVTIERCFMRNMNYGIYLNFTNAVNSGASIKINNTTCHDSNYGFVLDGVTADGSDIWVVNCNFEHNKWGFNCDENSAGNNVSVKNTHFEHNSVGGAQSYGANMWFDGGWGFGLNTTAFVAIFKAGNGAAMYISNMRLNGYDNKFCVGDGGSIFLDYNTVNAPALAFFQNGFSGTGTFRAGLVKRVIPTFNITADPSGRINIQNPNQYVRIVYRGQIPGNQTSVGDIVLRRLGGQGSLFTFTIPENIRNNGSNFLLIADYYENLAMKAEMCYMYDGTVDTKYSQFPKTSAPLAFYLTDSTNTNKTCEAIAYMYS